MGNRLLYECDACDKTAEHDSTRTTIPQDWCVRMIKGEPYLLCTDCGHESNFLGGYSDRLVKAFKERHGIDLED